MQPVFVLLWKLLFRQEFQHHFQSVSVYPKFQNVTHFWQMPVNQLDEVRPVLPLKYKRIVSIAVLNDEVRS